MKKTYTTHKHITVLSSLYLCSIFLKTKLHNDSQDPLEATECNVITYET